MVRTIGIQIFHFMLLERGALDGIDRAKTVLERRAGADVTQLGLNHRPQVTGRVVPKFDHFARFSLENDDHTAADLGCWNCHC
jgi:hypothetical protein